MENNEKQEIVLRVVTRGDNSEAREYLLNNMKRARTLAVTVCARHKAGVVVIAAEGEELPPVDCALKLLGTLIELLVEALAKNIEQTKLN